MLQLSRKRKKFETNLHYFRDIMPKCNEWRDPSPRLSAWTTRLRKSIAAVASRWLHYVQFHQLKKRTQDLVRL